MKRVRGEINSPRSDFVCSFGKSVKSVSLGCDLSEGIEVSSVNREGGELARKARPSLEILTLREQATWGYHSPESCDRNDFHIKE